MHKSKFAQYANKMEDLTISTDDVEVITQSIKLPNDKPMIMSTVYRPYLKCKMDPFIKILNKIMTYEKNGLRNAERWICGDFNIHFNKEKEAESIQVRDSCKEVGLKILISGDTRPYSREESCIDNILTNSLKVKKQGIP